MSNSVDWLNPYADRNGKWLKGNLHTHTFPASGCGEICVEDCLNQYVKLGYDFVSISDHLNYTQYQDDRITILPGVEWNSGIGEHAGVYSLNENDIKTAITISNQDELLEKFGNSNALIILNHPNWQLRPHYRREELEQRTNYDGIEIYNGVIERLDGYAISTDKWDYLLAKGRKVLGFASDDSHRETDIGMASIFVRAKTNTPQNIMTAIKSGNFYSSSGALIDDIRMENGVITLETSDAQEIHAIVDGGRMCSYVKDKAIKFDIKESDAYYIRFTVYGCGSDMAWTQPFFL